MRLVKPLPVCGVERGWGVELGFLVILDIVCSAPCKTLTRVWRKRGGDGEWRGTSQSFWW